MAEEGITWGALLLWDPPACILVLITFSKLPRYGQASKRLISLTETRSNMAQDRSSPLQPLMQRAQPHAFNIISLQRGRKCPLGWQDRTAQSMCFPPGPLRPAGEGGEAPWSLQVLMPADLHPVSHPEQGLCAWWVLGCSELPCSTLHSVAMGWVAAASHMAPSTGLLHRA